MVGIQSGMGVKERLLPRSCLGQHLCGARSDGEAAPHGGLKAPESGGGGLVAAYSHSSREGG